METKSGGQVRKVNFVDELDVTKTDTKSGGQRRKANFVDSEDLTKCKTIMGQPTVKIEVQRQGLSVPPS